MKGLSYRKNCLDSGLEHERKLRYGYGRKCYLTLLAVICLTLLLFSGVTARSASASPSEPPWESLKPGHPRLFIDQNFVAALKANPDGWDKASRKALLERIARLPAGQIKPADRGIDAATASLAYLMTGKAEHLDLAKKLLQASVAYYRECDRARKGVSWRSHSRINAICAYDWLFNDLSPEERQRLGSDLLDHVDAVQPGLGRPRIPGENWSEPGDGFYGAPSLLWYVGIALYGQGIDDARARRFAAEGYRLYQRVLELNRQTAGDDGGMISTSLNYVMVAYPWADFNFLHTARSAFGLDLTSECPHLPLLVNYVLWNWLPGNREFGAGDAYHDTNQLPLWEFYTHLAQIRHFFHKSHPDHASLAAWLQERTPNGRYSDSFPVIPLLLTGLSESPPPKSPAEMSFPAARHFSGLGQFFMHSGWGDEDTYALFNAGGSFTEHKHYDESHFSIFSRGFFALDTGSRPEPGSHLYNYYCRSIAHNTVLIQMPGEKMPGYWGDTIRYAPGEPPLPTPNDGGQRRLTGSKLLGYETSPEFTYIASDAAPVYHSSKCSRALRQFVFIPPRHFVIFDRVVAKEPGQLQTWLLHTAREIDIEPESRVFQTVHEQGRLIGRTLLPADAVLKTVGGPGRQFFSGGRNWPLPQDYRINPGDPELFDSRSELLGTWRLEVAPEKRSESVIFLHLLETGSLEQTAKATEVKLIESASECGAAFEDGDLKVELTFGMDGSPSGKIKYEKGEKRFERPLTDRVQPQSGLFGRD